MFKGLDEEKTFKIAALFLIFAIIMSSVLLVRGVFRTCKEDYNPCGVCMKAGYQCFDPAQGMPSIAFSPQDLITVNDTWNLTQNGNI